MKINNIDLSTFFTNEYVVINFIIFDEVNNKAVNIRFIKHFYIVNNLKVNIFLNNDILKLKNIVFYINKNKIIIDNCDNFSISLKIVFKNGNRIKRKVCVLINVIISIYLYIVVFIKIKKVSLSNCDLMFNFNNLEQLNKKNVFLYIVDVNFFFV